MNKKPQLTTIVLIVIFAMLFILSGLFYTGVVTVDIEGNIVSSIILAFSSIVSGMFIVKILWQESRKFIRSLKV